MKKTEKMAISVELKLVTVNIEVSENATNEEIIKAAQTEFLALINQKFPTAKYSIVSKGEDAENTLTFENVFVGQPVKTTKDGAYGVVTKINKKTISVTLAGKNGFPHMVNGHPAAFVKVEKSVNLHEVLPKRNSSYKGMGIWGEGEVGYFVDFINKKVRFVSVNKVTNAGKHQLSVVNENTKTIWKLDSDQMKNLVFDTLEEAEEELKKR